VCGEYDQNRRKTQDQRKEDQGDDWNRFPDDGDDDQVESEGNGSREDKCAHELDEYDELHAEAECAAEISDENQLHEVMNRTVDPSPPL